METGFFKWVWRFNAIVIAIAALIFLVAALFGAWEIWKDMSRNRNVANVINVDQKDSSLKEELSYGRPAFDRDGNTIVLPLIVSQDYVSSEYIASKSTYRNTINYLIINRNNGDSRWVFPGHKRLITNTHDIRRPLDAKEEDKETVAWLYEIVTEDSNDDKRLSERDRKTLIIASPDRYRLTEVLVGYDDLVSFDHPDNNSFEVIVQTDGKYALHKFSIQSRQPIGKVEFPDLPTSRQ